MQVRRSVLSGTFVLDRQLAATPHNPGDARLPAGHVTLAAGRWPLAAQAGHEQAAVWLISAARLDDAR